MRELKEETGYWGEPCEIRGESPRSEAAPYISPASSGDPGLSNSLFRLVSLWIDSSDERNLKPTPNLDEGEHVTVHRVAVVEVYDFLQHCSHGGMVIDGKLYGFALGLRCRPDETTTETG